MPRLSNQPPRDIAGELRSEIKRLQDRAEAVASAKLRREIGGLLMATQFAPSRLQKCPRDRAWLQSWEERFHAVELGARQPQIARLQRKLARLEAHDDR